MKKERILSKERVTLENQNWYKNLSKLEEQYLAERIFKAHNYFSRQDRKYRRTVRVLKLMLLFACFANTIVLGLKTLINIDMQVFIGLVISASTTLLTSVLSYFNYEAYWMRNASKHIRLNGLRDRFVFEAVANRLTEESLEKYLEQLSSIIDDNAAYWEAKGQKKYDEQPN